MAVIDINFPPKLVPILNAKNRWIVMYGGRNGAKSYNVALTLLLRILDKPEKVLCCRETSKSTDESIHALFTDLIVKHNLPGFTVTKTAITHENGSSISFTGLLAHTVDSIKSFYGCTLCWVEEASSVSEESWRKLIYTIREEGSQFFCTFNPQYEEDWVYKNFVLNKNQEDSLVIEVSYRDNPFLSETSKKEIEQLKRTNIQQYLEDFEGVCKNTGAGTPIYADLFNKHLHLIDEYHYIPEKPLILAFDFGETRSAWMVAQEDDHRRLVIVASKLCFDTKTDKLADEALHWVNTNIGHENYTGLLCYCDIQGKVGTSNSTKTDWDLLKEKGIFPIADQKKGFIVDRINVVRKKMSTITQGKPELMILNNQQNEFLIKGFMGRYRWKEINKNGETKRTPVHDDWSHEQDGLQYIVINRYAINPVSPKITQQFVDYNNSVMDYNLF